MKMQLNEQLSFTTSDLFKQLFEARYYVDHWTDQFPEDIDNWTMDMELTEFGTPDRTYRIWIKLVEVEWDEFIVNGYFQTIIEDSDF